MRALVDKDATKALGALCSIAIEDHDALREFYAGMMDRYVTTLHIPNSHVVDVDPDAGTATGELRGRAPDPAP